MVNKVKIQINLLSLFCFFFSCECLSGDHRQRITAQEAIQELCNKPGIIAIGHTVDIDNNKKYIKTSEYPLGILSDNSSYYNALECYKRIPPGSVIEYIEKYEYRSFDNPLSKGPSWSGLWYKVIADDGGIGWVIGESVWDKKEYAVEIDINTIANLRRPTSDQSVALSCGNDATALGRDEIIGTFAGNDVDVRYGAGGQDITSFSDYDFGADQGELTRTGDYPEDWDGLRRRYIVRDGELCEEAGTDWYCLYVRRCDPDGTGNRVVVFNERGEIGFEIGGIKKRASNNGGQHMPVPDPKETAVTYSAEEIRGWYFFGEAGGNEFLKIYLSDAMQVFRAKNTAEILGRVNTVSQNDPPEQVLADIEKALKDFVEVVDLIALLGAGVATQNDKYGELYTLYLINRARTQNQTASFRYQDLEKDGFKKASPTASAFHAIGLDPSLVEKWTHVDGREYVYTIDSEANRKLIFDGINNGTYNYCSDFVCHMIMDVMPWVLWGATINDTTTPNERAIAFRNAFTALRYVKETKGSVEKWTSFDF